MAQSNLIGISTFGQIITTSVQVDIVATVNGPLSGTISDKPILVGIIEDKPILRGIMGTKCNG